LQTASKVDESKRDKGSRKKTRRAELNWSGWVGVRGGSGGKRRKKSQGKQVSEWSDLIVRPPAESDT